MFSIALQLSWYGLLSFPFTRSAVLPCKSHMKFTLLTSLSAAIVPPLFDTLILHVPRLIVLLQLQMCFAYC